MAEEIEEGIICYECLRFIEDQRMIVVKKPYGYIIRNPPGYRRLCDDCEAAKLKRTAALIAEELVA